MVQKIMQTLLSYFVCAIAFEDVIYVYGQGSQEMQEQGRTQYQLLQERGNLPHYGTCWKDAVKHVNEGCRTLSEETQSDIALYLTNCFLAMSGHDTYNCELNKKPNLRGICINSMTDRAFNVYTEFYTHTQNICWFLRGQIWHETIAENTWKVGQQLEDSAKNQEQILVNQKESLELQERLIDYGNAIEKSMEKFYQSSKDHQEILSLFSSSLNNLQSWILGEISWFDTLAFYVATAILLVFFTSVPRTSEARLITLTILTINTCVERLICYILSRNFTNDIRDTQVEYYKYVWYARYMCMLIITITLILTAMFYKNVASSNIKLLTKIHDKINYISNKIELMDTKADVSEQSISYVTDFPKPYEHSIAKCLNSIKSNIEKESYNGDDSVNQYHSSYSNNYKNNTNSYDILKENVSVTGISARRKLPLQSSNKYNLRNRSGTPDIHV